MIKVRKKLIETALPLDAINAASAREKSIRHGHPSTLHLWWARRPLAAARAVIFAQMVDDPASVPEEFPTPEAQEAERQRLFAMLEQLVLWENTADQRLMKSAQEEIKKSWRRTCDDNKHHPDAEKLFNPDQLPPFHDPFAGGGAIPLEAQRLGLYPFATDLNPVAVLINKAMIEIPQRFAGMPPVNPESQNKIGIDADWKGPQGLAEDVRYYGQWMRDEAEKRIGHLYPKIEVTAEMAANRPDLKPYVGRSLTVIAWIWARTVHSPNPAFQHVHVPLASTFMLSAKAGQQAWIEPIVQDNDYRFVVKTGRHAPAEAQNGTKLARGANFQCLLSKSPIAGDYIKQQGKDGKMGSRLMAIVAEGDKGRVYLSPTAEHEQLAAQAKPKWKPESELIGKCRDQLPSYGMNTFGDLFTPRQLTALTTLSDLVAEAMQKVKNDFELQLGTRTSSPQEALRARRPHSQEGERLRSQEGERPGSQEVERFRIHEEALRARRPRSQSGVQPLSIFHRTRLPHFEGGEIPQHITFRLADSLPQSLLQQWDAELRAIKDETNRDLERRRRIEEALDQGHGACWLDRPEIAQLVADALNHFDTQRYNLHAWVIMPNHVHVLITPLNGNSLSSIVHSWKSFTAKQANKRLGREGAFWQEDYFDRFIRNEEHWYRTIAYIHENPVKAGLCAAPEDWRFGSAFEANLSSLGASASRAPEDMRTGRPLSQQSCEDDPVGASASLGASASRAQEEQEVAADPRTGRPLSQESEAYAQAIGVYLAFALDSTANRSSNVCTWTQTRDNVRSTFARQAIPMVWDYAECNPFSDSTGNFLSMVDWVWKALLNMPHSSPGNAYQADASQLAMLDPEAQPRVFSTDPPYYDNIGYADLSDFFYVWLRSSLRGVYPDLFKTLAVPKTEELIAAPHRHGGKREAERFFLDGMTQAMSQITSLSHPAYPITIYYAFKQAETKGNGDTVSTGWDTFLEAVIRSGLSITGTWPMRTEMGARSNAQDSNALASSIVLVCRPRQADAPTATRRQFLDALKQELNSAVRLMQGPGSSTAGFVARAIAPVDLAQAAIGPGMAIFTRFSQVTDMTDCPLTVRDALALINQVLDEVLAEQEGDFDADTRWAIAWFEQHGFKEGDFGNAETLSKAKNTSVEGLQESGILSASRGKVRLLKPDELSENWNPATDNRLSDWEVLHQLIRVFNKEGEEAVAKLVQQLGSRAETARELSYRLYLICDRKKRPQEALPYNALAQSWQEIATLAQTQPQTQTNLFGEE